MLLGLVQRIITTNLMNCEASTITLGICGASGAQIARTILELIITHTPWSVDLLFTPTGAQVWRYELEAELPLVCDRIRLHSIDNLADSLASGSYPSRGMVVAPCSMGTLAKIALGISDNLLTRAADVTLKEKRRLILVPREMPLSTIHLRNMLSLSEMGAIIAPPVLTFYNRPTNIQALCTELAEHLLELLGISPLRKTWQGDC